MFSWRNNQKRGLSRYCGNGFFFLKFGKFWPLGNENSRCKLQNLGILHDFKEILFRNEAHILPPMNA